MPDHSVLTLKFSIREDMSNVSRNNKGSNGSSNQSASSLDRSDIYYKRFKTNLLPSQFLKNDLTRNRLIELIDEIELLDKNE